MSDTKLLTNFYRYSRANGFINSVTNNAYYFFVGDHIPHSNGTLADLNDDTDDTFLTAYGKMIMGKKIKASDVMPVIKNIPWASQLFYMYDNEDSNLPNEAFFCIVNEGSYYHIWKCLDNNNNGTSTVAPSFAAGATALLYQTSDGYRWKYMATVDSATATRFQTQDFFPLVANSSVTAAADNLLKIVKIDANNQGAYYNNYIDGTFSTGDIRINGDPTLFNISNNVVQTVNGYYTGCIVYLT